jgi:F-type H+-transporting ATPase subunit epsilon
MTIALHILSPEGTLVKADVSLVTLPGLLAPFTVLPGHAALVTALEAGDVRYVECGAEKRIRIKEGFAEVKDNVVTVCVEA